MINKKLVVGITLAVLVVATGLFALVPSAQTSTVSQHSSIGSATFKGHVYVFARGTDNALYIQDMTAHRWEYYGGILTSGPTATATDTTMYVFVRGSDGLCYYRSTTNGWAYSEWSLLSDGVLA